LNHDDCPEIALALRLMKEPESLSNPKLRSVAMILMIYEGFAFVCLLRYLTLIVVILLKAFRLACSYLNPFFSYRTVESLRKILTMTGPVHCH
jgi:hypothetical protein